MTDHPEPEATSSNAPASGTPKAPEPSAVTKPAEPIEPSATGPSAADPGIITEEDRRWSLIAHYGAAVLLVLTVGTCGWLAGLLTLFLKGASPVVRVHAAESVNFQLTWGLFTTIGIITGLLTSWTCVGLLFGLSALLSGGFAFVFAIIGGRNAARGSLYRYPLSFRVIQ